LFPLFLVSTRYLVRMECSFYSATLLQASVFKSLRPAC
jgi:hypothetical protein